MNSIVEKADRFVFELFKEKLPTTFVYHNYTHTKRVVKSAQEIIDNTPSLTDSEKEIILLAAWLHDSGYTVSLDNHETHSIAIAKEFLEKEGVDQKIMQQVAACIEVTNVQVPPRTPLEEIIKDADCSHFAKDYFKETSELLRQEMMLHKVHNYSPSEWLQETIKMFTKNHRFYTVYAIKNWTAVKNENLISLLNEQAKQIKNEKKEVLKAKIKNENPERGIQTLYRVTLRNHLKLSDIADTKANILLSVNAIIITVIISGLGSKLDNPSNAHLLLPTFILMLFSVASIIGAILSTRPNISSGRFDKEDVLDKKVNILFFGNFHKMPFQDFTWAMNETIQKREDIYEALNKDLFSLGVVLNRKYKLLRVTYIIFMLGIILSVLAYIISFSTL